MKIKTLLVLIITILYGCSNNEDSVQGVLNTNSIDVKVENTSYKINKEDVGGNENCNSIFISSSYKINNNIKFLLNFSLLKNGELSDVRFDEFDITSGGSVAKNFFTPEFNPIATMEIKNFIYNPNENYVYFEFEGTVHEENNVVNKRQLSGTVEVKNLKKVNCTAENYKIEYLNNEMKFNTIDYFRLKNSLSTNQTHTYFSNNGFKLNIKSVDDFWNLPLSTINFNEIASNNKVEFLQYIGPLVSSQAVILNPQDWKIFETRGNFTIEEKIIENGFKTIKGTINMEVLYQGNLIYTINNMNYSTGSLNN